MGSPSPSGTEAELPPTLEDTFASSHLPQQYTQQEKSIPVYIHRRVYFGIQIGSILIKDSLPTMQVGSILGTLYLQVC